MALQQSAISEWILAALWIVLLVGVLYALAINEDSLFQLLTAAMFLLVGLTLLVQKRLASKRGIAEPIDLRSSSSIRRLSFNHLSVLNMRPISSTPGGYDNKSFNSFYIKIR